MLGCKSSDDLWLQSGLPFLLTTNRRDLVLGQSYRNAVNFSYRQTKILMYNVRNLTNIQKNTLLFKMKFWWVTEQKKIISFIFYLYDNYYSVYSLTFLLIISLFIFLLTEMIKLMSDFAFSAALFSLFIFFKSQLSWGMMTKGNTVGLLNIFVLSLVIMFTRGKCYLSSYVKSPGVKIQ